MTPVLRPSWPAWLALALALTTVARRAEAHPGVGLVRDSRGNLYYTDLQQVWKQAPNGTRSVAVANVHTHQLCVDSADNVYGEHLWYTGATEQWGHYVWRRSAAGVLDTIIRPRRGFLDDYDDWHFVRDGAGAMYWADVGEDSTIIRRRTGAALPARIGVVARARPGWLASANGRVFYVADGTLHRIDARGVDRVLARDISEHGDVPVVVRIVSWFSTPFRKGPLPDHDVGAVWADSAGNVYVAVPGGRVVKRVSSDGRVTVVARAQGEWTPISGLSTPDGSVILLETGARGAVRTRRVTP